MASWWKVLCVGRRLSTTSLHGVTVSTPDSESGDGGSNPPEGFFNSFFYHPGSTRRHQRRLLLAGKELELAPSEGDSQLLETRHPPLGCARAAVDGADA